MNFLQALYCNQHYELKPKGKAHVARKNGNGLVAVSLVLNLLSLGVLLVLLVPGLGDSILDFFEDFLGRGNGRAIGMLIAGIPFLVFIPLVRLTIGSEANYEKLIADFESREESEQKRISGIGLKYFFTTLIVFGVSVVVIMIVG